MGTRARVGALLAGVALAASCGGGGSGEDGAREAAQQFARAWETADTAALSAVAADPGEPIGARLGQINSALQVRSTEVVIAEVETTDDGATASYEATHALGGLGRWTYEGALDLVEVDGEWRVDWAPDAFHPALDRGAALTRTRNQGVRAPILARYGQPLTSSGVDGRTAFTAAATVGQVEAIDGAEAEARGLRYEAGDVVGTSGLEAGYDEQLRGTPTGSVQVVRNDGSPPEVLEQFGDGPPPEPVTSTLDLTLQTYAEQAVAGAPLPAAMVVVDPTTGAVRAVANSETGFDRAVLGEYPPGSTFKVVTVAAMLAEGTDVDTPLPCPLETRPGDSAPFVNAFGKDLGTVSLETAFAESCNTTFVDGGFALGGERMKEEAERFGFGAGWDPGIPAVLGQFPLPESDTELGAASIGQGRVSASPLQMASVAAAAYDGTWRAPHFVDSAAQPGLDAPLPEAAAEALPDLMRAVVVDGSGTNAAVEGHDVGGKTGTAEFGDEEPPESHAWFIGFADGLAFAVVVEGGGVGGEVAAPIAAEFIRRLPLPDDPPPEVDYRAPE